MLTPLHGITAVTAQAELAAVATTVTVRYRYDWQAKEYTGSVTCSAPDQADLFGVTEKVIDAPFCATARQAELLARYWCGRLAVPQWYAVIDTDRGAGAVQVGDYLSCLHPHLPGGAVSSALVTELVKNLETSAVTITLLLPPTTIPKVVLTGYSGRFAPKAPVKTRVTTGQGVIDIVIADDAGKPLVGAVAMLDDGSTATADATGRVLFRNVSSGRHTVEVRAAGHETFTLEVTA